MTDQPATTAGEQDHSDPAAFTGAAASPPEDCGRPPDDACDPGHATIADVLLPPDGDS